MIARISLRTTVSKDDSQVKNYSLNNRQVKNPYYKEENEDQEDDPDPEEENIENPQKPQDETSEKDPADSVIAEDSEGNKVEVRVSDEKDSEPKKENKKEENQAKNDSEDKKDTNESAKTNSALDINKDSLLSKLKDQNILDPTKESTINELSKSLDLYNEGNLSLEDFYKDLDLIKEKSNLKGSDIISYIRSLTAGLNPDFYKAASLDLKALENKLNSNDKTEPKKDDDPKEDENLAKKENKAKKKEDKSDINDQIKDKIASTAKEESLDKNTENIEEPNKDKQKSPDLEAKSKENTALDIKNLEDRGLLSRIADSAKDSLSSESENLKNADKELKAALEEGKSLEEIQNLLYDLGDKYALTRDEQEKLMRRNDQAIKDLVKTDQEENFRPNKLRVNPTERSASSSFEDKVFNLKTQMQVKATPTWPIPLGWHFDVKLGEFLKADETNFPLENLTHPVTGEVLATPSYYENGDDHFIRYTYVKRVTQNVDLDIDQNLVFDTANTAGKDQVKVEIKIAPKNNPVQTMDPIIVDYDDDSPVRTDFVVVDKWEGGEPTTYPYQLSWSSKQSLVDKNGNKIESINPLDNHEGDLVQWDIEVDTKSLTDDRLNFENLVLTLFASNKEGLDNFEYKVSTNQADLDDSTGYKRSSSTNELYLDDKAIAKTDLGEKLYIRVKAPINTAHPTYSLGLRINPDSNYIETMVKEKLEEFRKIPTIFKWLSGLEEARRFTEAPFNLVETNIPANLGIIDNFTDERFFHDASRSIVADRITDTRTDWQALDLLRIGESPDSALDNPEFRLNSTGKTQNIRPRKVYYVPKVEGGYRRTTVGSQAQLENGSYYPGTIIAYEYPAQRGSRDDAYHFKANIKEKKQGVFSSSETARGGDIDLFTEKISQDDLKNGLISYMEKPYPIMRITSNFDMVQCFNLGIPSPVYEGGKKSILLDKNENPSGDFLISRLNESRVEKDTNNYKLRPLLKPNTGRLNDGTMSEGQAMESLMKRIFFYKEEIKKEYKDRDSSRFGSKGEDMHRLLENNMLQKVIHYYTDGMELDENYFYIPTNFNQDEWKHDHTLTGSKKPGKNEWAGDQFIGSDDSRKTSDGLRKLPDNEENIKDYPPVKRLSLELAQELLRRVEASYGQNSNWTDNKADAVKLVFYSHTDEGQYQELITGHYVEPIKIEKLSENKQPLEGATFTFTDIYTGEVRSWTSNNDNKDNLLYLKPGRYRVEETAPEGYAPLPAFEIVVRRREINPDEGPYDHYKLPKIHVNDGYETEVNLDPQKTPKSPDGKALVTLDNKDLKLSVTNVRDNLGELKFTKKNKFVKLNGSEFTLRKIKAENLEDAKKQLSNPTYDNSYNRVEKGDYGDFTFDLIPEGYFILEETKVPEGYEKADKFIIEAKKGQDDKVKVNFAHPKDSESLVQKDGENTIINKTKKTSIRFRKVRKDVIDDLENEHLGLSEARFRLYSLKTLDNEFYMKDDFTSRTEPTEETAPKIDGHQAKNGGYIVFDNLQTGEYFLEELQAPKGYAKTKLYGWKLVVKENRAGELTSRLFELTKEADLNKDLSKINEINLDQVIKSDEKDKKVSAYQIPNDVRTTELTFDKYLTDKTGDNLVKAEKKLYTDPESTIPLSFDLYKADYYGAIVGDKINDKPIVQNIFKDENPEKYGSRLFKEKDKDFSFELQGLEFGGYYVLREKSGPYGYKKAADILLKVEAEAIANEGEMKVIVRDPNTNTKYGDHAIFEGVINYSEETKLGEFSIKKTGNAIGHEGRVGLRRAYFRLLTADENFKVKKDKFGYPVEYIQKVTPGDPITDNDGNGKDPADLPANQGIITFDQLKPGNYILEEYRGPAGYEKDPGYWQVKVDPFGYVRKKYIGSTEENRTASTQAYNYTSPRLEMAGVDINTPQRATNDESLKEFSYTKEDENAKVSIKAGAVDTTNGQRKIDLTISPKTKEIAGTNEGKKLQYVILLDRSKDLSTRIRTEDSPTIDKNINKFLSELAERAKKYKASIDVTFIEYSRTVANNYNLDGKIKPSF